MAPILYTFYSIVPHWLSSMSWDPAKAQGKFTYSYNDTTLTLGSWRWMQAQAEAAAERIGYMEVSEEGAKTEQEREQERRWIEKKKEIEAERRRRWEVPLDQVMGGGAVGGGEVRGGEVRRPGEGLRPGEGGQEGSGSKGKGCDLCLMITKYSNRASCCKWATRPYYLPEVMDPRTDERFLDVPLVFGRQGKHMLGQDVNGTDNYWEWTMVCLNAKGLFSGELVDVPGGWCKFCPFFFRS